jgi:HD-GYP domain-containing protein (c-di-GMP phosphodiesterase class II)
MEDEYRMYQIHKYVENMKEIRMLSTPDLDAIDNADDYGKILIENFSKIGELAAENREFIDSVIPIFSSDKELSDTMKDATRQLIDLLIGNDSFEEVDVHMSELLDEIMIQKEIEQSINENDKVVSMAKKVKRDYLLVSALTRYVNDEVDRMRKAAIDNAKALEGYLEKDVFSDLNEEAKEAALHYSLMGTLLYESNLQEMPLSWWEEALEILNKAAVVLNDPFYRKEAPEFDWEAYEFRIYYYGGFLAYSIIPEAVAKKVYELAEKGVHFLKTCKNETILSAVNVEQMLDLQNMAAVIGRMKSAREACDEMYKEYAKRDSEDYSLTGVNNNLDTPALYLSTVKATGLELIEEDYSRYLEIEESVIKYINRLPKQSDVYLKCATLLTNYPVYFKEVPGAMTMEYFCLKIFAAIHPPTYVHSNMVAQFAECMTKHLLDWNPKLFIGFPGCDTEEKVLAEKDRIIQYTYHAALCHDIGKLFIIDIISMYGRKLLDDEFLMIKSHPVTGAKIAMEHASTREYVDVIKGHHLWYDGSKGYPVDFDVFASPYKTVIDLVTAADCLDAATDTVGRSYSRGKTFSDYEQEIIEGAGSRYAPFLPELFQQPMLRQDIEYLLETGRKKMYRESFYLLKNAESKN